MYYILQLFNSSFVIVTGAQTVWCKHIHEMDVHFNNR